MFKRPGSDLVWDQYQLADLASAMSRSLPEGKTKQFFDSLRNELELGIPLTSGTEYLLPPMSNKDAGAVILIENTPGSQPPSTATIMTKDGSRNFDIPVVEQKGFLIFSDQSNPLTYREAYRRLGLSSIASLKIRL